MIQDSYNTILARLKQGHSMDSILQDISEAASQAEKEYKNIQKKEEETKRAETAKKAATKKIIEAINEYSELTTGNAAVDMESLDDKVLNFYAAAIERAILMTRLFE